MISARMRRAGLASVAIAAVLPAAHAEVPAFYALGPRPEQDVLAAGVLYFHAPLYAGSDEQRTIVAPSATAILANGFFADPISGVGWNLSTDGRFEFGPRATLGLGREEPAVLHGMGVIRDTIDVGGFANYNATERFQLQSALRLGSGNDHDGALIDAGASYDVLHWDHASVTLDAAVSFANSAYMQSYYGVRTEQALASGYPEYHPRAGVQWRTAGLSVTAPVHPRALGYFSLEYGRLAGPAAASPLVRKSEWIAIEASVAYGF